MLFSVSTHRYLGFFPPYRNFDVLTHPNAIPRGPLPSRGAALFWNLRTGDWGTGFREIRERPPGVALFLLLPPSSEMSGVEALLDLMEGCRPHTVLPWMGNQDPEEMKALLQRPPEDLPVEVVDYLCWRGLEVDLDTRRILRKIFRLSKTHRTVAGLARGLYMSRRALGRRLMSRGLPAPSHWLHFGRVLRASIRLQSTDENLFSVGCQLGYPDGFSLSNQMKRLVGLRPSIMKECFGWEWIVESWLDQEARDGNLSRFLKASLFPKRASAGGSGASAPVAQAEARGPRMRVAERTTSE